MRGLRVRAGRGYAGVLGSADQNRALLGVLSRGSSASG